MRGSAMKLKGLTLALAIAIGFMQGWGTSGGGRAFAADELASPFAGGEGTATIPYRIENADQLNAIRDPYLGASFVLTQDIDLSGYSSGGGWLPIGDESHPFSGSLDGGGHSVTGLTIARPGEGYLGLFGKADTDSRIANIRLIDVNVSGGVAASDSFVGSLVGWNKGTIGNSYATGEVSGQGNNIGGLAGKSEFKIIDSFTTVNVNGTNEYIGGLTGYNNWEISNSYATGTVSGNTFVGGLVGKNHSSRGTVKNSYATGNVTGDVSVGALVGSAEDGTSISNSYATGSVNGKYPSEGLIGTNLESIVIDSYYGSAESYRNWNFESVWKVNPFQNGGYPALRAIQSFVTYDGNLSDSGSAPVDPKSYMPGSVVRVDPGTGTMGWTKAGYVFEKWNTQADGTGIFYAPGDEFVIASDTTLYAQWERSASPSLFADATDNVATAPIEIGFADDGRWSEAITEVAVDGAALSSGYAIRVDQGNGLITFNRGKLGAGDHTITVKAEGYTDASVNQSILPSSEATLTSALGQVSAGGTADESIVVPYGTTLAALKSAISPAEFATFEIYDADGTTVATQLATGKKAIVTAQDGIAKTTYVITVNANPVPYYGGSSPTSNRSTDGNLTLPAGRPGTVGTPDGRIVVTIPANAANKELRITIAAAADAERLLTDKEALISEIYELLKNFPERFANPVTLTFTFDSATLGDDHVPVVFFYDEEKRVWTEVAGGQVSGNQIAVNVDHFTKFAVFAVDRSAKPSAGIALSDIAGHWAEAAIRQAVDAGIVAGYPDGTFRPDLKVTRAEFIVMLAKALKLEGGEATLIFADASKVGAWARQAVAQAARAGIVQGYSDGTLRPDAMITRAEMALMVANAYRLRNETSSASGFADDGEIPAWAKNAVTALKKRELIDGIDGETFAPGALSTRAETITLLLRMQAAFTRN